MATGQMGAVPEALRGVNPRVDTSLRFVQLILLLVASTAGMITSAVDVLAPGAGERACFLAAGVDLENYSVDQLAYAMSLNDHALDACLAKYENETLLWPGLCWAALLLASTVVVFKTIPRWRVRRSRFSVLSDSKSGNETADELQQLAGEVGLKSAPRIVVDPLAISAGASVFGSTRRPMMRIHGGLVALRGKDPDRFRSIVLHEFAHISNRDISITYAVVSMWRVFLFLVLLPYVGALGYAITTNLGKFPWGEQSAGFLSRDIAAAGIMVVLVYLARSELLRTRELHADQTAHQWGATARAWSGSDLATPSRIRRILENLVQPWRTHPSWAMRREALADPTILARLQVLPLVLTGLAAVLLWQQMSLAMNITVTELILADLASMIIPAVVMALSLWRIALHSDGLEPRVPAGVRAGFWVGSGIVAGVPLVSHRFSLADLPSHPEILLILLSMVVALGWWLEQSTTLWRVMKGGSVRWLPLMLLATGAWLVLAALWSLWNKVEIFLEGNVFDFEALRTLWAESVTLAAGAGADSLASWVLAAWSPALIMVDRPLLLAGLTLLWVVPLLAWAGKGRGASPALRTAIAPAIMAGIAGVAAGMLYIPTLPGFPISRDTDFEVGFILFLHWQAVLVTLGAVSAAVIAAIRARSYRMVYALIAGQVSMLIGAVGSFVVDVGSNCLGAGSATCGDSAVLVWTAFQITFAVVPLATTAAVVIGGIVVSMLAIFSRKDSSGPRPYEKTTISRGRASVRSWCIAIGCLSALLFASWQGVVASASNQQNAAVAFDSFMTATAYEPSPEMLEVQVNEWLNEGGSDLATRLGDSLKQLRSAFDDMDDHPEKVRSLPNICNDFKSAVDDARAYFVFPEQTGQQMWEDVLDKIGSNANTCVRAYEDQDVKPLARSTAVLYDITDPLLAFLERSLALSGG